MLQAASLRIKRDELHSQTDPDNFTCIDVIQCTCGFTGAVDELRNIKIETINAEMFAIPEGYKTVDSRLRDLNTETGITFGTADQ